MRGYYTKTHAGRQEIQARARPLSRTARNLLLIIDSSRPIEDWLAMLVGATERDVLTLLHAGLVEQVSQFNELPTVPMPLARVPVITRPQPVTTLGYSELYDSLNSLMREQLGLFRGFRFSLEVEKATNQAELVEVARRFIEEVRTLRGDQTAEMVSRALGFTR